MRLFVQRHRWLRIVLRLGGISLIIAGIGATRYFGDLIPLIFQLLVCILLPLSGLLFFWRDLEWLFGPVFIYDLIKSTRRGGIISHRVLLGVLLLGLLLIQYWIWFPHFDLTNIFATQETRIADRAQFANSFFTSFMALQLLLVFCFTPIYTSSALAEQKERRQLEFLFVTDLTTREIVFGTLGSRLARIGMLLLTGLPILSFTELLGGVDPDILLMCYGMLVLLMICLGSCSILESARAKTAIAAVLPSYLQSMLVVGVYLVLSTCCLISAASALLNAGSGATKLITLLAFLTSSLLAASYSWNRCRTAVNELRRLTLIQMGKADFVPTIEPWRQRRSDVPVLEFADDDHVAAYHHRVRYYLAEVHAQSNPRIKRIRERKPVGDDAFLWKESHLEQSYSFFYEKGWMLLLFIGGYIVFVALLSWTGQREWTPQRRQQVSWDEHFLPVVRSFGWILAAFPIILSTLSAANRISRERERQTLDSLLTIPTGWDEMILAKWLGSILCVRWLWLAPVGWYAFGLVIGSVHFTSFFLLMGAMGVYALFFPMMGLWLSASSGSTVRANLLAVLLCLISYFGPGIWKIAVSNTFQTGATMQMYDILEAIPEKGLSPVFGLYELCFSGKELEGEAYHDRLRRRSQGSTGSFTGQSSEASMAKLYMLVAILVGLHILLMLAFLFWILTRRSIYRVKGPRAKAAPAFTS